ncbi:MAG: hypothetical protein ABIG45_03100, partial [Bacillota bacterium]
MKTNITALALAGCILLLSAAGAAAESADPMDVVRTILNDPQVKLWEDAMMMDINGGMYFGDVAEKRLSGDGAYYEFASDDSGAYMIGNLNFLDIGDFRGSAQAILFNFCTEQPEELSFVLYGAGEIVLYFEGGRPMFAHRNDNYQAPYAQYRNTNLTVEPGRDYWALMAIDSHGYYRSLVWADDNPGDVAYCGENMGDWHSEYQGSNWHLTIAFGPNQTLQLQEYCVMDFIGIAGMEGINEEYNDGGGMDFADPMEAVNAIVSGAQVCYADDLSSLPERGYTAYSDVEAKQPGDGFEFLTSGYSDGFTFLTPLNDVSPPEERRQNMSQGVLLCFKTSNPAGLEFSLTAESTALLSFENGRMPMFVMPDRPDMEWQSLESPSGFMLEEGVWYYIMIAVDADSYIRVKIWEFGNEQNHAHYQTRMSEWFENEGDRAKVLSQNWTFGVG